MIFVLMFVAGAKAGSYYARLKQEYDLNHALWHPSPGTEDDECSLHG